MKFAACAAAWLCLGAASVLAQDAPAPGAAPAPAIDAKDAGQIASYGIGLNTGQSIKKDGVDIDLEAFIQGIRDGAGGAEAKYDEQQIRAALTIFQKQMQAKQQLAQEQAAAKNQALGQAFLAKNKARQGVKTLPSGLQYEVISGGDGASPKATDTVKVHYEGTLLDGTVFDSSIKRNEPATFRVNQVIPGWTEALQLMKVGDKWRLFIPSNLAYGPQGTRGVIGPNAMLIFQVELLGIEAPAVPTFPRN